MRRARDGAVVCLTAYTTPVARLVDPHCDIVLVGDSVGMVLHGLPSTLGVTLDMMIMHGQAVRRGLDRALMVVDMPFGSYEESPEQAFRNVARVMGETGSAAVKLEGGQQGRGADGERVRRDALAVAEAGAFAMVLEKVPEPLARRITEEVAIPTIGIGASPACDGQILVVDDMLGLFGDFRPKFVKHYAELGNAASTAIAAYAGEVRERQFPGAEHVFGDDPKTVSGGEAA